MVHYKDIPRISEKTFFMDKEVAVVKIIQDFSLAKVRYLDSNFVFVVDIHALKREPDMTKTISIGVMGGISK